MNTLRIRPTVTQDSNLSRYGHRRIRAHLGSADIEEPCNAAHALAPGSGRASASMRYFPPTRLAQELPRVVVPIVP